MITICRMQKRFFANKRRLVRAKTWLPTLNVQQLWQVVSVVKEHRKAHRSLEALWNYLLSYSLARQWHGI
jgi:hypothetical protein